MTAVKALFPPNFQEWVNTGFSSLPRFSDSHLAKYIPAYHTTIQPMLKKKILATEEELSHANIQLSPIGTALFLDLVEGKPPCISLELEALVEGAFIALEFYSSKIRTAMDETRAEILDIGFAEEPFNPKALAAEQIAARIKKLVGRVMESDVIQYISRQNSHLLEALTPSEIVAHTVIEMVLRTSLEDPLRSLVFLENTDTSSFEKFALTHNRSEAGMSLGNVHFRSHVLVNYKTCLLVAKALQWKVSLCEVFKPFLAPLMCHLDGTAYPVLSIGYGLNFVDEALQSVLLGPTRKEIEFYHKTLHSLEPEESCPLEIWEMMMIDELYCNIKKRTHFESFSFDVNEYESFDIVGEYYEAQIRSLLEAFRDAIIKRNSHDCALCRVVQKETMDLPVPSFIFEKRFIDKISKSFSEAFKLYPRWVAKNLIPTIRSTFLADVFSTLRSSKYFHQSSRCPCFVCPRSAQCGEGCRISPNKCIQLTEWILFLATNKKHA